MVTHHARVTVPYLFQMLGSIQAVPLEAATPEQLRLLDAVYQVMGLTVNKLAFVADFSFPAWFTSALLPILKVPCHCPCIAVLLSHTVT